MNNCPSHSKTVGCELYRCCWELVAETVQREAFTSILQSFVVSYTEMKWIEVISSVIRVIFELDLVKY